MKRLIGAVLALGLCVPMFASSAQAPQSSSATINAISYFQLGQGNPDVKVWVNTNSGVYHLLAAAWPQAQPKPAPSPTPSVTRSAAQPGTCAANYYRNSSGVCVHRPVKSQTATIPQGATAQCRDGVYSFSQHHRGTCSHHGGVARWL